MFRCSVYEKAYLKAVEMSALAGNKEYENYFSGMVQGILDEKAKHLKRAEERGEKIEQKEILRATKDYTNLLTKAYTEGTLADIAAAICPCSKLYAFIGREITRAFPDHHHLYSEWINTYSGGSIDESTAILDKIIDEVATEENKESLRFYYSEAMRLEFEFFNQQSHVPTLSTSNIFLVGHGDIACSEKVVECPHVADGTVDREGLATFVRNLVPGEKKMCETMAAMDAHIQQMSVDGANGNDYCYELQNTAWVMYPDMDTVDAAVKAMETVTHGGRPDLE